MLHASPFAPFAWSITAIQELELAPSFLGCPWQPWQLGWIFWVSKQSLFGLTIRFGLKSFFCAPFIQCLLSQKVRSLVHVFQITTALYKEQADNSYPVFDMGQPSLQNNLLREDNEMGYCGIEWKDRRRRLDMKVGGKPEGTRRGAVGKGLPNMAFSRELITTTRQQTVLCSTTQHVFSFWNQELRMCAQCPTLLLMPQVGLHPGTQCSSISPRHFPTSEGKTPCSSGHASRGCLMSAFTVVLFLSGLGTHGGISWQRLQCSSPGPCSGTKPECSSGLILHKNSHKYAMLDLIFWHRMLWLYLWWKHTQGHPLALQQLDHGSLVPEQCGCTQAAYW